MNDTFADKTYDTVARIPRGKVATYGQIAEMAGNPRAARAVGMLMSRNTDTKRVPCHRVVASDGRLTGYAFGGVTQKRERLAAEGVAFSGDAVNLAESLWSPN